MAGEVRDIQTIDGVKRRIDYNYLANKPSIPTKTSELQNDSGFITSVPNATSSQYGAVKVDNDTIKVNAQGQIYVAIPTASGVSF